MRRLAAVERLEVASSLLGHNDDDIDAGLDAQAWREDAPLRTARLSADERDVLLLIAWEELTYVQTEAALELPIGTVRSRLNRARTRFVAHLRSLDDGFATAEGARID